MNYYDSRNTYPNNPPVAENVMSSVIQSVIPASSDIYFPFEDSDQIQTNQLLYSGGLNNLIKIPLQTIDSSMFRTQDILITPYNIIKYSNKC